MNKHLPYVEYIRGLAAVLVTLYHATLTFRELYRYEYMKGIFHSGYMGVHLFFVLSGFIIYYMHHQDLGKPERLRRYLLKRFVRIFPVYWFVLAMTIPIYFIFPTHGEGYERSLPSVVTSVFLLPYEHMPIVAVAWTLRNEIVFYLLFGLLMLIGNRFIRFAILSVWLAALVYAYETGTYSSTSLSNTLLHPYNMEFLLGCFTAHIWLISRISRKRAVFVFWLGIILLIVSWVREYTQIVVFGGIARWAIPSAVLLFGSASMTLSAKGANKVSACLFKAIGEASYSIYLIHYPLLAVFNKIMSAFGLLTLLGHFVAVTLCVSAAVFLGWIFHLIVERPILTWCRKRSVYRMKGEAVWRQSS